MQDHSSIPLGLCQCGCGRKTVISDSTSHKYGYKKDVPRLYCRGHQPKHKRTLAARFWEKVNKNGPIPTHRPELGKCWLWQASKDDKGYGKLFLARINGESRAGKAHAIGWELTFGAIRGDFCVCHHCDNPLCVRPDHLFLGTKAQNTADMIHKQRHMRNGIHPSAKLTPDHVREIRESRKSGVGVLILAKRYDVCRGTIDAIMSGRSWRHV